MQLSNSLFCSDLLRPDILQNLSHLFMAAFNNRLFSSNVINDDIIA